MGDLTTNAARSMMNMRADVERDQASGNDPYGGALAPNWSAHATIACRVWSRTRREVVDGDKTALVEEIRCAFPLGTDVTETDSIAQVTDRAGSVLWDSRLAIQSIAHKHSHLEADLRRVES